MVTALEAYRRDRAEHSGPFSSADSDWLLIVGMVSSASQLSARDERRLMKSADDAARDCFGADELGRRTQLEWKRRPRRMDALVLLAAAMQEAGAIHTAGALVGAALLTRASLTDLQRGRLAIQRAQVTYKLGDRDLAAAQYQELDRLGRKLQVPELRARAALGLASIAQLAGNYPEILRHSRTAVRFAQTTNLPRLRRRAHSGVMIAAGQLGYANEALLHGWEMYLSAKEDDVERATSVLILGQSLLRFGEPVAAHSAFSSVIGLHLPSRVLLSALGGVAATAAHADIHAPDQVRWATREVQRFRGTAAPPYAIADAFLQCSVALGRIGDAEWAASLRREALAIAERYRFHELVLEAEQSESKDVERLRLSARARPVARHFDSRPPRRLPAHVQPTGDALAPV